VNQVTQVVMETPRVQSLIDTSNIAQQIESLQKRLDLSEQKNERLNQELSDLRKANEKLRKANEKLNETVSEQDVQITVLKQKVNELEAKMKEDFEEILLGELAFQIEKALCLRITGNETLYSMRNMIDRVLPEDNLAYNKWENYRKDNAWNNYLEQTINALKLRRVSYCHPVTNFGGQPLSRKELEIIVSRKIKDSYEKSDALKLIELLSNENGEDQIYRFRQ